MAAVLIYFRRDLLRIARAWVRSLGERHGLRVPADPDARMGWYILLGTVPISVFGVAFQDQIETGARDLTLIAIALIALGLVLLAAEAVGTRRRGMEELELRDGIVVGFAQAAALVPGVSRSGATISAGLFLGLDRPTAARFSFLLSVPAVVLSGVFELISILDGTAHDDSGPVSLAVATLLAFVVGYASIAWLLRFLATHSTAVFVAYRVVLGTVVLVLVGTGAIS